MQISMLLIFYVLLAMLKLADELPSNSPGLCVAAGLICQFVYLSSMFWLNSIRYEHNIPSTPVTAQPVHLTNTRKMLHRNFYRVVGVFKAAIDVQKEFKL